MQRMILAAAAILLPVRSYGETPVPAFEINCDPPDIIRIGADRYCPLRLDPKVLVPGVRGNGIRVPLESANLLPSDIAAPAECSLGQWQSREAILQTDSSASGVAGEASVRIDFRKTGSAVFLPPLVLAVKSSPPERTVSFVFSCYLRAAGKSSTVRLTGRGKAKNRGREETSATASMDVELSVDSWRRAAAAIDFPSDSESEEIVWGVENVGNESTTVFLDALQLERRRNWPQFQDVPTDWMPGNSVRLRASAPSFSMDQVPMPIETGAISIRVKLDPVPAGARVGDLTWLEIGEEWNRGWELSDRGFSLGGDTVAFPSLVKRLQDGAFHCLAMTWTGDEAAAYLDGALLNRVKRTKPFPEIADRRLYRVVLGMGSARPRTGHGVIDDVAVYDRALTREELLALGRSGNDMERNASELRLSTPARQDFTRDELSVELTMRLHGPEVSSGKPVWRRTADSLKSLCFINDSAVRADAVVNAAPGVTLEVKPRVEQEGNGVEIGAPLSPGQFSAGRKECVLRVVVNGIEKEFRQSFAIHPARPQSNYGLMLWSCRTDPESLRRYRDAGVRIVDVRGFRSCPVIRDLESFGMTASAHYGNYHPDPHPAAPANWDKMMFDAQVTAPVLASQAHVIRYCLLNSEVSGRDDVKASPKVMQALKEDIGLDDPPFPPGAGFADLSIRPKLDLKAGNSGNGRTAGVGRGKTACPGTPWVRGRSENS